MKNTIIVAFVLTSFNFCLAQSEDKLPYYEIPDAPKTFTAGTMASRMVDALGFRFHWATADLTEKDLAYKLNEDGRSVAETIDHIYDLSVIIFNSTLNQVNVKHEKDSMTYAKKRERILYNLEIASDLLQISDDLSKFKIIFPNQEIPFWNAINGPIADAIWHCGQIAVYRRATGNPINSKVSHFSGKVRD